MPAVGDRPVTAGIEAVVRRLVTAPPRWSFHVACALPAALLVWSASYPGLTVEVALMGYVLAALFAFLWVIRAAAFVVARRRRQANSRPWWFAVAPLGAVLVLLVNVSGAPLEVRWRLSREAFDELRCDMKPGRVGMYDIRSVSQVAGGCLLFEEHGSFLDDAGFAYLPDGPSPSIFVGERSHFEHLDGPWWTFTASW